MDSDKIIKSKRFAKEVQKVLNRHDPVGLISKGAPVDEYDYQQAAIIRKLVNCKNIDTLQDMLHKEFCHWFNPEKAGPSDRYRAPATDLFRLFREFKKG